MVVQGYYEGDIRVRRKAEALVAAGFRVDALALRAPDSRTKEFDFNGVHVYTLDLGKQRASLARYGFEDRIEGLDARRPSGDFGEFGAAF